MTDPQRQQASELSNLFPTMASGQVPPAGLQSESPAAGSAEFLTSLLKAPGHACGHTPKYRIVGNAGHHEYPSRLGFFHMSKSDTKVSYLDTSKLCKDCLDLVVPMGYNYWSILSAGSQIGKENTSTTTHETGHAHRELKWLDAPSSATLYPQIVQARAEQLPRERSAARADMSQDPDTANPISIPGVTGASKAWKWLISQQKPFYTDQLHSIKGWTALAERIAVRDFSIARQTGTPFIPTTQQDHVGKSTLTSGTINDRTLDDIGAISTGINNTSPKDPKTTKTTRKKNAPDSAAPEPITPISPRHRPEPNTTMDLSVSLSKNLSKQESPSVLIPKEKNTPLTKSARTDKLAPGPIRPSIEHTQDAEKPVDTTAKLRKKPQPRSEEYVSTHVKTGYYWPTSKLICYRRIQPISFSNTRETTIDMNHSHSTAQSTAQAWKTTNAGWRLQSDYNLLRHNSPSRRFSAKITLLPR